jgi:hypothetical protein
MGSKLRQFILDADDIQTEKVFIDQWKIEVEVKGLMGIERAKMLNEMKGAIDFVKLYPQIVIATTYDPETGEKVFEAADIDVLNTKSGAALEQIAAVAMKLSGLQSGAVTAAEKNSEKTLSTDSISN